MMLRRFLPVLLAILSLALFLPTETPTAQAQVTWSVEFYNNPYLINPVVATTSVSSIATDWGGGSPWAGVNADNWSARFSTNTFFTAGTYRFFILADDGVQLWIDGSQVLGTFNQNRASQLLTVDVALSQGNHGIQVDFQELEGNAYLHVNWANLATNPTTPNFPTNPSGSGACSVQFYNNPFLSGSPSVVTNQTSPNNNWGGGAPIAGIGSDNWSARWTCPQTLQGAYQITTKADDGVRVFVNGVPYIDEWHGATGQTYTNQFTLPLGTYNVVVEYFEQLGNAFLEFNLSSTNTSGSGIWAAQYFDNINLGNNPVVTLNENDPTHNWGSGAPFGNIPADNWSARWSSSQNLGAGTYQIRTKADDGVRVYVDGNLVINEWHDANGQVYTNNVTLTAGTHTFVVEFYERGGNAALEYSLTRVDSPVNPPSNTGAVATINTSALNVRNAPNRFTGAVIERVRRGETYSITGRNQDSSWWQLDVRGTLGWVNARYVLSANTGGVPIVDAGNQDLPANTGFTVTTDVRVNMRGAPSTQAVIVGVFTPDSIGQIVGRSSDSRWLKINFVDLIGWVSADYVIPQQNLDYSRIPVMPI